jgi:hypothetical protein
MLLAQEMDATIAPPNTIHKNKKTPDQVGRHVSSMIYTIVHHVFISFIRSVATFFVL